MRKKTYFIGVTHEIERIRNYSIGVFEWCKIYTVYFIKKPNPAIGFFHVKKFILLQPIPEFWCCLKHLEQNYPR